MYMLFPLFYALSVIEGSSVIFYAFCIFMSSTYLFIFLRTRAPISAVILANKNLFFNFKRRLFFQLHFEC